MGVAAFYRWLVRKYPKVQSRVIEEKAVVLNGIDIPVDATKPNPNGTEFDNFYLDMNAIVHPCCHPQFKEAPATEEDMMLELFSCLDRVFNMIRPRKLVYMALDGVAPRAKMNQQRSRRFRAAQEAEEKAKDQAKAREEVFRATGERPETAEKPWDSNCITPGTPFMELLAKSLRYYVAYKLNTDPAWRTVKVLLSDSNVPGEGEHKIMGFIRRQRMMPSHDPNTTHVIYGLDADLIMLSLATHEPHFRILREDVAWADTLSRPCGTCGKKGHFTRECKGPNSDTPSVDMNTQPFVFAHMDILREYLGYELQPEKPLPFPFDLERAVDDWVFLCFFVGNDFLPHLPSLEIREGAIEKLVEFWKEELPAAGGYITHDGAVDLFRIQPIMDKIGGLEEETFRERKRKEDARDRRAQQNRNNTSNADGAGAEDQMSAVVAANARRAREDVEKAQRRNFEAADKLRAKLAGMSAQEKPLSNVDAGADEVVESGLVEASGSAEKRTATELDDGEKSAMQVDDAEMAEPPAKQPRLEIGDTEEKADEGKVGEDKEVAPSAAAADYNDNDGSEAVGESSEPPAPEENVVSDNVKFHETGYKERYYSLKFGISADDRDAVGKIVEHYVRGLCWVLQYYYQGCASWGWFYPYYYAPLASDFSDLDMVNAELELGEPLRPFEQLMGVLPAASRKHLPEPFGELMTSADSPIIDFYPTDFPLDMDGKKFLWQAVVLLPFIDKQRLLSSVQAMYPKLTPEESARNGRRPELLLVADSNPLYESLCDLYAASSGDADAEAAPVALNPRFSGRMSGAVSRDPAHVPHTACISPLHSVGRKDIEDDRSIGVIYQHPQPESNHTAVLLPGVRLPRRALTSRDIELVRSGETARPPNRWSRNDNNRDFGHFYRQQGNDVSADRGYGPRRYDERGNANPAYQRHHSRGRGAGGRPPPHARPPHRGPPRQHASHQLDRNHPYPKRPSAHPPAVATAGRGARGGYRGGHRGGHRSGGDHWTASNNGHNRGGGGYRGGYRGRGGY